MPLKFATETLLIVLLGFVTILTGVILATLPALPAGLVPGIILLLATLAYAFSYSSLFRRDRVEYAFRLLHLFPAAMVVVWFILQGITYLDPAFDRFTGLYTWGWSLGPVVLGFFLLLLFCLSVIRLWGMRLLFLILLLVPFVTLGVWSRTGERGWEQRLASTLWQGSWWNIAGSGAVTLPGGRPIAYVPPSSQPVFTSSAPSSAEVAWSSAVAQVQSSSSSSDGKGGIPFVDGWFTAPDGTITNSAGSSSSSSAQGNIAYVWSSSSSSAALLPTVPDTTPPATPKPPEGKGSLAHSGPFTEVFMGLLLAGYTTAVHGRARKRLRA